MAITAAMVKELREKTGAAMMACKKALLETDGDIQAAVEALRKSGEAKAAKRSGKTAAEGKVGIVSEGQAAFMIELNSETDFSAGNEHFNAFFNAVLAAGMNSRTADVESTLAITVDGKTLETARTELVSKIGENIQLRRVALVEASGCVGHYIHGDRIGVVIALDKDNAELAKDIAMHVAATNPEAITPEDVPAELITKEREIFAAQAAESGKPAEIIDKMVQGRVGKFLKEVSLTSQPFVKDPNTTIGALLQQHHAKIEAMVRFEVGEGIEKESQNFADEVMAQVQGKD